MSHYTATHWGVYRPVMGDDGRLQALQPAPWDAEPSAIGQGMVDGVDSPVRVRRPAVRQGWLRAAERGQIPGHARARGQEPFVELPWDEALDLVAAELQRVKATHGNRAIFGGSYGWASAGRFHHAPGQLHRFLNGFGGYVYGVDTYSLGAGRVLLPHIVADMDTLLAQHTPWDLLAEQGQLFVAFGGLPLKNGQVSPGGASDHGLAAALQRLRARGVQFVNISPVRHDLDAVPEAQWLPVRPGTDAALMLALAQVWCAEGLHDTAFLARCCAGFEVFERYLLGRDDGQPKTPEWAAPICGIAAEMIRTLARRMAGSRTMINTAYALQRAVHGEQPFWLTVVLAAMLGQIGTPGGGFGLGYGCMANTGNGRAAFSGPRLPQGVNPVGDFIPVARLVDMLLQPGAPFDYNGQRRHYPDIKLVYWAGGNVFHHHQDLNRTVAAWQRPDSIIVHEPFWTATARHADVVLPATTPLERDDVGSGASDRFFIAMRAAIAPVGQARDDHAILAALARRLGFEAQFTEGRSPAQWLAQLWEASRERAQEQGITLPGFDDFWRDGVFEPPRPARPPVMLQHFVADPRAHPLPTPSGRIQIHSPAIAAMGYADCPGHPVWRPPPPAPAGAPLQLLSHQPATRLHSQYDHGATSRAAKVAGREPVWLHPADAAARGIADGEVVEVFNALGRLLAGARLSDGIAPGVVLMATGAWFDPQPVGEGGPVLCVHGNPNVLTPDVGSSALSQGCAAQSAWVQVRRWQQPVPALQVLQPPPGVLPVPG